MAKVGYVARETATNLRRNLSMASAALLTVTVSLALVGGALLVKQGVGRATVQWRGNVELSIYMKADASSGQVDAIGRQLRDIPTVKRFHFVDKPAAYAEFRKIFANEPDLRDSLTVDQITPSYRITPRQADQTTLIGQRFNDAPGVFRVSYAKEEVDALVSITNFLQFGLWGVALVLLLAASLLIVNTIRMAIFARRREVGVMKLVGATNWFIRLPFMLEGLVQGLAGAAVAFGVMWIGHDLIQRQIQHAHSDIQLFKQFQVTATDVSGTGVFLMIVGVVVGTLGSALAVSRFLDV